MLFFKNSSYVHFDPVEKSINKPAFLCLNQDIYFHIIYFLHPTGISPFLFLGLEYSSAEGTNYPPKFDSSPGELLTPLKVGARYWSSDPFLLGLQVFGGLLQRSGALRIGMRM